MSDSDTAATLPPGAERALAETRAWVERAVIGLNLCPFAKAVAAKGQIRYVHSDDTDPEDLLSTLCNELELLARADPAEVDTTLIVHPRVLTDFLDYNDFLDVADEAVAQLGLEGVLQVASFHPDYQFEGSEPDDPANASNRSPWPTLHLLREDSVDRAVDAFPEAERIYEVNIETLRRLGPEGWAEVQAQIRRDAEG
ncbi:DUF1415 domain-containing protein [Aquabacterium sp. J223]|uniref:DUF1415 domain-containing protein n=1 Tax=Aquabacterium sp. J223 TaxID=2898431 RepID=UPI0021ADE239|nr:DUF1415 domain-containing protein [Aquabacterium sp. J223]UUX94767.1 DUF1415 domain-containing protein [Aquabacterium sp. J223]